MRRVCKAHSMRESFAGGFAADIRQPFPLSCRTLPVHFWPWRPRIQRKRNQTGFILALIQNQIESHFNEDMGLIGRFGEADLMTEAFLESPDRLDQGPASDISVTF